MEKIRNIETTVSERVTDFMEKAPGLISFFITLVIVAGLIG